MALWIWFLLFVYAVVYYLSVCFQEEIVSWARSKGVWAYWGVMVWFSSMFIALLIGFYYLFIFGPERRLMGGL